MTGGTEITADVTVVGAGPAGLFAVFACGQLGMTCAVIDALPTAGGQLTALYPEKPIYDIPGMPEVRADALVASLVAQAAPYGPKMMLARRVERLERAEDVFHLHCSDESSVRSRAVILAAGPGAFGPNRPPLGKIENFEPESVRYHVTERDAYRGKTVVIAGGGDSAVDWAVSLAEVARSVAVVHRRDRFRAAPAMVARMKAHPKITLHTGWQLAGLTGIAPKLDAVDLISTEGARRRVPADILLPMFGLATDLGPIRGWGLALDGSSVVVDAATCETTRSGVFAIGDLAAYPGKRKLILTGFAEAAVAAEGAFAAVHPGKVLRHEHSTTRGAPGRQTACEPAMA